jgi:AraC-like DNA-binding protein
MSDGISYHNCKTTVSRRLVLLGGCVLISMLAGTPPADAGQTLELRDWEYRWGTARDGRAGTPEVAGRDGWLPARATLDPPGRNGAELLWLRARLPQWQGIEPSVFLDCVIQDFEAFHDGRMVYRWGDTTPGARHRYPGRPWHIIPLAGSGGGALLLRIRSPESHIGVAGSILVDTRSGHLARIIRGCFWRVAVSFLFLAAGLFAMILFARRREETSIAAFGCILILMASWNIAEARIKQVLLDAPLFWLYAEYASLYLVPVPIGLFVERLFGAGPGRIVRRGWQVHLAYAVTALGVSVADPALLRAWTLRPFQVLLTLYLVVLCAVIINEARRGDFDARIVAGGIAVAILLGIYDIAVSFFELGFARSKISYWGILAFIVSLGVTLDRRIRISPAKILHFRMDMEQPAERTGRRADITQEVHKKLDRAIGYMEEHCAENISREGLAAYAGMNHDYFGKMFRLYTGKRVGAYLNELRVRMAAALLAESDQAIVTIAFDAGFESIATFYRVFQAVTGLTPTAYRDQFGKNRVGE